MNSQTADSKSILEEAISGTLLFTSIFNSCQDAIDFKTPDGVIRAWNPAAEKLYGYTAEEIIGKNVSILHTESSHETFLEKFRATIEGRLQSRFEAERITKEGDEIVVNLTLSPVVDSHGNLLGLSAISHDITEEKIQTRKRIRLEKDREELLSILANDVSNSLNQFERLTEAFDLESDPAGPLREMVKALKCDNRRFLNTLENLILVYDFEKGRSLNFVSVDLEKVVQKNIDELKYTMGKQIQVEFNSSLKKVITADFELLSRLFKNILSWAMSQSCSQNPVILELNSGPKDRITVITRYDADKFSQNDTKHLFSSAWRSADGAETGGLSGLGLFLARRIAESHDGCLELEIKDNKNIFCLELPIEQVRSGKILELNRDA